MSNFTITGTAYYAWTKSPQQPPEGKNWAPKYNMQVIPKDDAELERIKAMGISTKKASDSVPGVHVKCVRNITDSKGNAQAGPSVVDSQLNPVDAIIGNGSTVNVKVFFNSDSDMQNPRMEAIQVTDFVAMEGEGDTGGFGVVSDGFVATPMTKVEVTETESTVEEVEAEDDYDEDEDKGLL